jgi:hypothetical protein
MAAATKRCYKCGRMLPLDAFNRNRAKKDGLDCLCRKCKNKADRQRRQAKRAERTAKAEHTEAEVRGLASFLKSLDLGEPHTATWWRQAARDGGFGWAGYGDVRAALSLAGIEPFDLRRGNLYAVADDYGRSGTRKTGKRKSTRLNGERHPRTDESAPQGHKERKDGVQ